MVLLARIGDAEFGKLLENTLTAIENWQDGAPVLTKLLSKKIPYNIATITSDDGRKYAGIMRRVFGKKKDHLELIGDKTIQKEAFNVAQIALILHEELRSSKHPSFRNLASLFTD